MKDFFLWLFGFDELKTDLENAKADYEIAKESAHATESALNDFFGYLTWLGEFALLVAIMYVLVPPVWRAVKWLILREKSLKPIHFLDGGPGGPEQIEIDIKRGKYVINLPDGHPGLFVRPESWVQHPDSATFEAPRKRHLIWARFKNDLYWLYKIPSGGATLETQHHGAYIARIALPKGERLIVKLRHVVAFSCNTFPLSARRQFLNIPAYVQRLTKCTYFEGPAELYVFGIDGIEERRLTTRPISLKSSAVIGWTPGLLVSIATQETLLASLVRRKDIAQTCFSGDGVVISQSLAGDTLDREAITNGSVNSWWQLLIDIFKPF